MYNLLLAVHIIVAIVIIALILVQHGKGADAGASFGAGSAATVFGAGGSASFLTRLTAGLAGTFFITSLLLAGYAQRMAQDQLRLVPESQISTPAAPAHGVQTPPAQPAVSQSSAPAPAAPTGG